jgi:hypothetical protein
VPISVAGLGIMDNKEKQGPSGYDLSLFGANLELSSLTKKPQA